jgi:hypothetical protein
MVRKQLLQNETIGDFNKTPSILYGILKHMRIQRIESKVKTEKQK